MPEVGRNYLAIGDWRGQAKQMKIFRAWRPWMWGPLRNLWTLGYESALVGQVFGPVYRWKTEADRRLEERMRNEPMCPIPDEEENDHE